MWDACLILAVQPGQRIHVSFIENGIIQPVKRSEAWVHVEAGISTSSFFWR